MPVVSSVNQTDNPFEGLFADPLYLELKNHLYNYMRRREEIAPFLAGDCGRILEIGSGVSPIAGDVGNVIFSDLEYEAMRCLKRRQGTRFNIVSSAAALATRSGSVRTVICSEVLEHVADDGAALREIERVLALGGRLIVTVPVNPYLFSCDDSYVGHKRRYKLTVFLDRLRELGFTDFSTSKISGLLEKIAMICAVSLFRVYKTISCRSRECGSGVIGKRRAPLTKAVLPLYKILNRVYAFLVRLEAKVIPFALCADILIVCEKRANPVGSSGN